MTPKEKANELFYEFYNEIDSHFVENEWILKEASKQCALIAVDEIMQNQYDLTPKPFDNYWQEVKQEIENI